MRDEELHELMEDYLRGAMTDEAEAAFRERINNDPVLAGEVDAMRVAMLALRQHAITTMQERIADWKKETPPPDLPVQRPALAIWPWLRWGLTLLAVVVGVWWFTRPPRPSALPPVQPPQEVPAAEIPPGNPPIAEAPAPVAEKSGTPRLLAAADFARQAHQPFGENENLKGTLKEKAADGNDRLSRAKNLLRSAARKDANAALQLLNDCAECDATARDQWRGHALFRLGRYPEALKAYSSWQSRYQSEEAQWYQFLAALANNKKPADIYTTALKALENPEHRRHQSWLELEAEMKKAGVDL